jgi:predicted O-methyltransferase YrrM
LLDQARKVARVGVHLLTHPQTAPRWLRLRKASCLQTGIPWISFGAIDALERSLHPNMTAFEFGSGGSTVFLAERCASLTSVEHDGKWADATAAEIKRRGLANATLVRAAVPNIGYEEISGQWVAVCDPDAFKQSDYFAAFSGRYDLVFIDGADDFSLSPGWRSICFRRVEPTMSSGGIIVLDDVWAYPDVLSDNVAKHVEVFEGLGPSRNGPTSTAIFHY